MNNELEKRMITLYHLKLFIIIVYCVLSLATLILAGFSVYWCVTILREDRECRRIEQEERARKKKLIEKIRRYQQHDTE